MDSTATRSGVRRPLGAPALGLAVVACWWVWLGRDTVADVDPVTGAVSGPYSTAQVAGCVLCLVVIVVVAAWWLPAWTVDVVAPLALTAAFISSAFPRDDSGLWGVGAAIVLVGSAAGCALLVVVTAAVRRRVGGPGA
jgi:hypothetical protein